MLESALIHLEGDGHIEYCLAFLYCDYASGREALPIPNAVHFIKDRRVFLARSQEVAVQAMANPAIVYRSGSRPGGLCQNLTSEDVFPPLVWMRSPIVVKFDLLKFY